MRMAHGSGKQTLANARRLRRDQTPIELRLWKMLRGGRLAGFKFRRQHPLGPYIVDFFCEEARLIIEVDGNSHAEQEDYDRSRTDHLESLGYRVRRVTNREVLGDLDGVLQVILGECQAHRP